MEGHTYSGQVYLRQQLTMIRVSCQVRRGQHGDLGKSDIPLFLAKHSVNGLYSEVLAAQQDRISQVQLRRHNFICNAQKFSDEVASCTDLSKRLQCNCVLSAGVCFTQYATGEVDACCLSAVCHSDVRFLLGPVVLGDVSCLAEHSKAK